MKAKQRTRPVTDDDVLHIAASCRTLAGVVSSLRHAKAGNAANYVARALKSAQGALNNAQRMLAKQERAQAILDAHKRANELPLMPMGEA